MQKVSLILAIFTVIFACKGPVEPDYDGKFCSGTGDTNYLRLIDESFAFLSPNPVVPNLSMIYKPEWNTFTEGAGWNEWWIQNSYGFSYAATPFLREPWFSTLQHSWDLFWNNQGDGKRTCGWAGPQSSLVAPDGCLGDCATPQTIAPKQGDGDPKTHDWFYEATAAGVVMQAEILLAGRDRKAMEHYLPKMERACNFIETTRDPENNLFLVGPACNLLAPSYGGVKQPDGSFGKGYLAGLSVTYLAALDRMVELYKLTGDTGKLSEYGRRQAITRGSLPQLLTPEGYFVKSVEPGGIRHGVLGQSEYGYLEGVANADAAGLRVVDYKTAESIYNTIAAFPDIRPFDFLLTNAPGLDDTYWSWGDPAGQEIYGARVFGCWVNGGVWGTVEGRAILMYYRLGKFGDIYRSAVRAMKWAKDFRFDDHFTQRGENSFNLWYDKGRTWHGDGKSPEGVTVTVDNFAIPAAVLRGLFDYDYKADRLILRPRVPGYISHYSQKEPVRFGEKSLYISCRNGGPQVKSVKVNGKKLRTMNQEEVVLMYSDLPAEAKVEIVTDGGWEKGEITSGYPEIPSLSAEQAQQGTLPDSLQILYTRFTEMDKLLKGETGSEFDRSFVSAAMKSFEAYRFRAVMETGPGYFRPIDQQRKEAMIMVYAKAAAGMYQGFENRMQDYAREGGPEQKKIASLFFKLQ